jgi:hypothetical protein
LSTSQIWKARLWYLLFSIFLFNTTNITILFIFFFDTQHLILTT